MHCHGIAFFGGVEAEVSNGLAHGIIIFLLRVTVIVLVVGPGTGSLDVPRDTPGEQGFVDEFHAVIVMSPLQREGKLTMNV
jgi:hypothetical protein